jgi:hypothetical protein
MLSRELHGGAPSPHETDRDLLRMLGSDLVAGVIDRIAFRERVVACLQNELDCSDVAVWRVSGRRHARMLTRVAMHSGGAGHYMPDLTLPASEVARHLDRLVGRTPRTKSDPEAAAAAAAAEARLLGPPGGDSTLHAAGSHNGQVVVVLCCGSRDARHAWTTRQQSWLRRHAAAIALTIARLEPAHATGRLA